jgi:hypothetical protein
MTSAARAQLALRVTDATPMSASMDGVRVQPPEVSVTRAPKPRVESAGDRAEEPSSFQRLLQGVGRHIERGQHIVSGPATGYAGLGAAELIALQAGIYRYSEAVDLTAKLVDRATNAVRTVLQAGQ